MVLCKKQSKEKFLWKYKDKFPQIKDLSLQRYPNNHNASWFSKLRKGLFYQNVLLGNSIKSNANNDVIKPHHKFNFSSCLNATVQLIATKNILVTNTNAQKNGFLTQCSQHHEMFKKSRKKNATKRGKKKQKKTENTKMKRFNTQQIIIHLTPEKL